MTDRLKEIEERYKDTSALTVRQFVEFGNKDIPYLLERLGSAETIIDTIAKTDTCKIDDVRKYWEKYK